MSTQERIAKLEREIEALKAEEAKKRPLPKRPPTEERGVTITYPVTASTLIMPSDGELIALADIGIAAFPQFGPQYELGLKDRIMLSHYPKADIKVDREKILSTFRKDFKRAFLASGSFYRTAEPCRTRYVSHWADQANTWLRSYGLPEVETNMVILAALVHHDIPWTDGRVDGCVFELGVDQYTGAKAHDAWRKTLRTGKIRPATPVPADRRMAPASPTRVYGGY
jgi:hypothetical protein